MEGACLHPERLTTKTTISRSGETMKAYIITEIEFQALLKELELEKFKTPDQFATTERDREAQLRAVQSIHQRMHFVVCRAIQG